MDNKSFCREAAAWLDPFSVLEAGRRFEKDANDALKPSQI